MAYNKRTWLGRQGTGLNKFSIGGASPVTIVNQPDSVTQVGDALSAGNLNDLEDRIEDAFDETASQSEVTNLNNAITAIDHRLDNLEQPKGGYVVQNYKGGAITPSGKGNWAIVEGVRGVSRVANNAIKNGDFSQGTSDWSPLYSTLNVVNGVAEITKSVANPSLIQQSTDISLLAGHSYLGVADLKGEYSVVSLYDPSLFSSFAYSLQTPTDSSFMNCSFVYTIPSGGVSAKFGLRNFSGGGANKTFYAKNVGFVDLNIYFGTSDLSFLGNTDSAKLATIQQKYPWLLEPSEYGVRIVDSSYSGVNSIGFNRFDKTKITTGKVIDYAGNIVDGTGLSVSDFMPIQSGGHYYLKSSAIVNVYQVHYYDVGKNWIGRALGSTSNTDFYALAGACYARININTSNADEVNFNVSDSSLNGQTFPYMENTLSLTFQGKSAGSVSEMYYPETGEKTHPIGSVDLGTISWYYDVNYSVFIGTVAGMKFDESNINNCICSKYANSGIASATSPDKTFYPRKNGIGIKDSAYTSVGSASDPTTFLGSLQGVMLYYELATPDPSTFVTPIIDNTLLTESGGRMATVQTGTVVDGSFDMGFITL